MKDVSVPAAGRWGHRVRRDPGTAAPDRCEDPFWVGVLEVRDDDTLRAARHVFGAEPTGPQLCDFAVGRGFDALGRAVASSAPVPVGTRTSPASDRPINPKRLARQAAVPAVSTAAQRALQQDRQARGARRRQDGKAERERRAEHRRAAAVRKAKARHRGR